MVALVAGMPAALAAFTSTSSAANSVATAADWVAPSVGSTVIAKQNGYLAGSIKQGGTYYVYANVADSGNPPSGISTVKVDESAVTSLQTNVSLTAGSYSVNGVSYNYRTAVQTASSPLSGTKNYTITSTDALSYSQLQSGYSVTIDNTAPTATNIQTANNGSTVGKAQQGDTITFTFSEQIDPQSILAGWTGASTSVVVRLEDGGCTLILCGDDSFRIFNAANSSALPFGTINLNAHNYTGGGLLGSRPDSLFGATGTASTMVQSGATITITLGTASGEPADTGSTTTMAWSPSTTPYDAAGNLTSSNSASEGGGSDKEW